MSDFETHETGTAQKLNLVEHQKELIDKYEPYIKSISEQPCECAKQHVKNLPCISCQARALLNG